MSDDNLDARTLLDFMVPAALNRRERGALIRRFRSQVQPSKANHFSRIHTVIPDAKARDRRLDYDGLSLEDLDLLDLKGLSVPDLGSELIPEWARRLAALYGNCSLSAKSEAFQVGLSPIAGGSYPFLEAFAPILVDAVAGLAAQLSAKLSVSSGPFGESAVHLFIPGLLRSVYPLTTRVMALELNVQRIRGHLTGDTPTERFASFIQKLSTAETMGDLIREYPVLFRDVLAVADEWQHTSFELAERLAGDWPLIRPHMNIGPDAGSILAIESGKGDSHGSGRSVTFITFESGLKIVYKPRPVAASIHLGELLEWLASKGGPDLRIGHCLDRGDYGWTEFVEHRACQGAEELQRFYWRQGALLAVLYVLRMNDVHYGNLIASGEYPVPVDLETMFQNTPTNLASPQLALHTLNASVCGSGLLPWKPSRFADFSGLGGGRGGQFLEEGRPSWAGLKTDEVRMVFDRRMSAPTAENRPVSPESDLELTDYVDFVVSGFQDTYKILQIHAKELSTRDGFLSRFKDDQTRFVARRSSAYATWTDACHHPDRLRNGLDREVLYDQYWSRAELIPDMSRLIPSEIDDIRVGDIPYFSNRPGGDAAWTSAGARIPDFFPKPALVLAQEILDSLSDQDLVCQSWLIRASIALAAKKPSEIPAKPPRLRPRRDDRNLCEQMVLTAAEIGDMLINLAFDRGGCLSWLELSSAGTNEWAIHNSGLDLYQGSSGICLFLSYLGAVTGKGIYTETASRGWRYVSAVLAECGNRPVMSGLGGFCGWGSVIYAASHLTELLGGPEARDVGEQVVGIVTPLIEQCSTFDIIGGAAGCIGALIAFGQVNESPAVTTALRACADRLTATGLATIPGAAQPLAGFSHGAAGMAWALLKVYGKTGEEAYRKAAFEFIDYERSVFSREQMNWPDFRPLEETPNAPVNWPTYMVGWCHGAPGIGMARLDCLDILDDGPTRQEIEIALATTHAYKDSHSDCLCHGTLGNLDFLVNASQRQEYGHWESVVKQTAESILAGLFERGLRCATPAGVETPGLMTGLAGIGYQLLRLAHPARVPSVLILEPPPIKRPQSSSNK